MSHLTSETREVWVPVYYAPRKQRQGESHLYKGDEIYLCEGSENELEDDALAEAQAWVAEHVEEHDEYVYAKVERRIVPTYK